MNLKECYEAAGLEPDEVAFMLSNEPFTGLGVALFDLKGLLPDEPIAWWASPGFVKYVGEEGGVEYPVLFRSPTKAQKRAKVLNEDPFSGIAGLGERDPGEPVWSLAVWIAPKDEWSHKPLGRYLDLRRRFPGCPTQ